MPSPPPSPPSSRSTTTNASVEQPRALIDHRSPSWSPMTVDWISPSRSESRPDISFETDWPSQSSPRLANLTLDSVSSPTRRGPAESSEVHQYDYTGWYGLRSRTQCLASSSPLLAAPTSDHHPVHVQLLPPSADHPITTMWETAVVPSLLVVFDRLEVPMVSIHLIRLSRPDVLTRAEMESSAETIVWVGVEEEMSKIDARRLVSECLVILGAHGVPDVGVEVHTSQITRLTGPAFMAFDHLNALSKYTIPFTAGVGIGISRFDTQRKGGTGGIYLRLEHTDDIFLLTCQHVIAEETDERHFGENDVGKSVLLLGQTFFKEHVDKVREAAAIPAMLIQAITRGLSQPDPPEYLDDDLKTANRTWKSLDNLQHDLCTQWTEPEDRVIGNIYCHPPLRVNVWSRAGLTPLWANEGRAIGWSEDWGLIQLDPERFSGHSPNAILLEKEQYPLFDPAHPWPLDHRLRISGILPLTDLSSGDNWVLMRGAKSGIRVGRASPAKSYVRTKRRISDGETIEEKKYDTWEIPVFGHIAGEPFSDKGDSGSSVVDCAGRVLGMVHAGEGSPFGTDISLVSPIQFIFDRMNELYGLNPRLA